MPEIIQATVEDYLRQIRRTSRRYFLSINQEGGAFAGRPELRQIIVPQLAAAVGGFKRQARYPYWIRKGYVEEVYEVLA